MLGDAELISRVEGGESDRVEFTSSTTVLDKFRQAICAFANDLPGSGEPGLLFIGAIHRNYENSHTPVRISWLADRVEILSPGSAFGEVGRGNFGRGATSYRNPTIAEAMKNMGFMQRFGIGIETARRTLAVNGNPPPEFDVQDAFVLVTVRRRP